MTRKGAIRRGADNWAMIPGSMGTRSYIVVGKETPDELPLGAARRRPPLLADQGARRCSAWTTSAEAMEGIEYRHSKVLLDEIPGAYKDIDQVMENAKDLVEVKYVLKQFVNVKGDERGSIALIPPVHLCRTAIAAAPSATRPLRVGSSATQPAGLTTAGADEVVATKMSQHVNLMCLGNHAYRRRRVEWTLAQDGTCRNRRPSQRRVWGREAVPRRISTSAVRQFDS